MKQVSVPIEGPDWSLWEQMPTAEIWQAVALTCNLNPDEQRFKKSLLEQGSEFRKRLKITRACAEALDEGSEGEFPLVQSNHVEDSTDKWLVRLIDFAAWATRRNWKLPDEFAAMARKQPVKKTKLEGPEKPMATKERDALLNIIGGLLGLMLSKSPAGKAQSVFKNQAAIISALLAHYPNKTGISQRTLDGKFAEAKQSLSAT